MNYEAELSSKMKDVLFGDIVELITYKVNASEISLNNYISTDNMLPNCGGVTHASSLPSANKFNAFTETDTLFSNIRTYFRKVWFAGFSGGASPDVLIFRSKDKSFLDPHFLYYLISNKTFIDYTDLTSKGAKMPRGDKDAIAKFPVKLPSMNEQKSIVSVLGALDDKIENNRRMNETLEEMARAIFKSWFVDFDPVHAKAAGNAPAHMDAETAALFPNSFGNDGLPVGWKLGQVSELCKRIENGGTPKRNKADYWDPKEVNWLTSGEVRAPIIINTENFISVAGFENSSAKLWPPKTTVVALYGATAGQVTYLALETTANQACCGLQALEDCSQYVFFALSTSTERLALGARGSAQQNLSKGLVSEFEVKIPSSAVLRAFDNVTASLTEKSIANLDENRTLAQLRDTLLPKLMSGEIRVKDAEREVEAAV